MRRKKTFTHRIILPEDGNGGKMTQRWSNLVGFEDTIFNCLISSKMTQLFNFEQDDSTV